MLKIGIVGCGTIGSELAKYCSAKLAGSCEITSLFDTDRKSAGSLKESLSLKANIAPSLDELAGACDIMIEAASVGAAPETLKKAIEFRKSILIISVGGMVGREALLKEAKANGCRVYFPSGAVAGIDGIKAAGISGIDRITLTTRKPAAGLKGAPYIEKSGIDLDDLKGEQLIFEGSAREAIEAFPKNVNVSATLSLAGVGADRTKVRIVSSPLYKKNTHEIELEGSFGSLFIRSENVPSPGNPKTSYMAVLSAIATLEGIINTVRVGT
jgi:aspartate dehydrogenase